MGNRESLVIKDLLFLLYLYAEDLQRNQEQIQQNIKSHKNFLLQM